MSIEQDILELFRLAVENNGGNSAATAESLGVNPVTFWNWLAQKRRLNPVLLDAVDKAGGALVCKNAAGETLLTGENRREMERLRQENSDLKKVNISLQNENLDLQRMVIDLKKDRLRVASQDLFQPMPQSVFV